MKPPRRMISAPFASVTSPLTSLKSNSLTSSPPSVKSRKRISSKADKSPLLISLKPLMPPNALEKNMTLLAPRSSPKNASDTSNPTTERSTEVALPKPGIEETANKRKSEMKTMPRLLFCRKRNESSVSYEYYQPSFVCCVVTVLFIYPYNNSKLHHFSTSAIDSLFCSHGHVESLGDSMEWNKPEHENQAEGRQDDHHHKVTRTPTVTLWIIRGFQTC